MDGHGHDQQQQNHGADDQCQDGEDQSDCHYRPDHGPEGSDAGQPGVVRGDVDIRR